MMPPATPSATAARLLAGALLLVASAAIAQDVVEIDADALHGAWLVPSASPRTHVELVVLAGERDNDGPAGLAHYVEHLAVASAMPASDGAVRAGADSNATTHLESTRYWLEGPTAALGTLLETLARTLEPIELTDAFARDEVGIVRSEYEWRFRDAPEAALWLELGRLQHGEQWPARSVIGTPESIAAFTPRAARELHARTHRAGNAVLVVEGRHDGGAVARAVREAFGRVGAGDADGADAPIPIPTYRLPDADALVERRVEPRLGAPLLLHSRATVLPEPPEPFGSSDAHALAAQRVLLENLLGSARPGGLAAPLRYDAFVAARFGIDVYAIDARHVALAFDARPDEGVALDALHAAFEEALGATARAGIPRDSFVRARKRVLDELDSPERPALRVRDDALDAVADGASPLSLPQWRGALAAVTLDELNALLRALAEAPRTATLLVTPDTDR